MGIRCYRFSNGRIAWEKSIAYASGASDVERLVDIDADPIVQGNIVYLASYQGYVGALSLETGQFIWQKPASVYKNMTMDKNTLYMTDSHDILWALNKENGSVKWKQTAFKARGLTEPTVLDNRIIVGDSTGFIHILAKETGEPIGRTEIGGNIQLPPTVLKRIFTY